MEIHAHAIPQVENAVFGMHLMWAGPYPWIYSPTGWSIQRRIYKQLDYDEIYAEFREDDIQRLRLERERRVSFGMVTLREGQWPVSILTEEAGSGESQPTVVCDVFRLELDEPHNWIRVGIDTDSSSFALALRNGKIVATSGDLITGNASHELRAAAIDTVEVYILSTNHFWFSLLTPIDPEGWEKEPYIVTDLQLPLQELMAMLTTTGDEFQEAQKRLLEGETLDANEFLWLMDILRAGVKQAGAPRPIDQVLLLQMGSEADVEEMLAIDPIRMLLTHPKWRRVLGFSWFDQDSLEEGETYEYRISASFPAEDLGDIVYDFHTIPSQTALPVKFYVRDLHFHLSQPVRVERGPGTFTTDTLQISRRGIRLHPRDQDFWLWHGLKDWSLILDFPSPVSSVILELEEGHVLEYYWGMPGGPMNGPAQVPPDESRPRLDFDPPIKQLRLRGEAFLYGVRLPAGPTGPMSLSVVLPPVTLEDAPRPEPPLLATLTNLQQPQIVPSDASPPAALTPRHLLGFEVKWRPALQGELRVWPPDQNAAPPLASSIYQIEYWDAAQAKWQPVLPEENWIMGDRDQVAPHARVHHDADLMVLFPEVPSRDSQAGLDISWRDIFDFDPGLTPMRPVPAPGTTHTYRVRTIDPIGRPSLRWRETNSERLEKWVPPPVPVGPENTSASALSSPAPTGVQARVLVHDAQDLTDADRALLGNDSNVIVLRWGWHEQQREQDPFASEFRVYVADEPLDVIAGELTNVVVVSPGVFDVTLNLDREVVADAAKGNTLQAGYPFYICSHTGGFSITATIETRVPDSDGHLHVPVPGKIILPLPWTPVLTRPPAWKNRVQVFPITAETEYHAFIRNRLSLRPTHPRDRVWVGVSAADSQSYVPDQLGMADPQRPGNESAIVPVICEARFQGRPDFDVIPTLQVVPVFLTPESAGRPIFFSLDLGPYLTGAGLGSGDMIRPERASAEEVFAAYRVAPGDHIMARVIDRHDSSEGESELVFPNPVDQSAVVAALNGLYTTALEDRYVVYLAASHPYRDRLFKPAVQLPVPYGPFQEALPPQSGRYVYLVRKSDACGHLSIGGVVAQVIVRVPSLAPGAAPEKLPYETGDEAGTLRLRIAPESDLTHLLTFSQVLHDLGESSGSADLLRVPNAPDLQLASLIRLQAPNGELLSPQVKDLTDPDAMVDTSGFRRVALNFQAAAGARVRVWACTLTRDRVPSLLAGPWSLAMPVAPLPVPSLSFFGTSPSITFNWSWPPGPTCSVALERSTNGVTWQRISSLFGNTITNLAYTQPAGSWKYRLAVMSPDGRIVYSNIVAPS